MADRRGFIKGLIAGTTGMFVIDKIPVVEGQELAKIDLTKSVVRPLEDQDLSDDHIRLIFDAIYDSFNGTARMDTLYEDVNRLVRSRIKSINDVGVRYIIKDEDIAVGFAADEYSARKIAQSLRSEGIQHDITIWRSETKTTETEVLV